MTLRRAFVPALAALVVAAAPAAAAPPQTGFERTNGAAWTTHAEELAFLDAVDAGSKRARVDVIGRTAQGRPLHLVQLGTGKRKDPTALFVCSQHGNEPAGREACLKTLRDLAFGSDALLAHANVLFVPAANPDGRAADTRENSAGTDINRDHLTLTSPEARAIGAVVRDWAPDMVVDLHEYGPSLPVLYDDEVLYLWPRNLNVDKGVYDLSLELAQRYVKAGAEQAGYTTDEYGLYEVAGNDVHQSAGDGDEGILRNTMGLRHALGILVETRVDGDVRNGPEELADPAAVNRRRVASHLAVTQSALRFLRERGEQAAAVTAGAFDRKAAEGKARSAPVYFGGADNQEPAPEDVADPPPCGYRLTPAQASATSATRELLSIRLDGDVVSMAQPSEPVIPLLLDSRGARHAVEATPMNSC